MLIYLYLLFKYAHFLNSNLLIIYNSYFEFSAACKSADEWFNSNSFNSKVILKGSIEKF